MTGPQWGKNHSRDRRCYQVPWIGKNQERIWAACLRMEQGQRRRAPERCDMRIQDTFMNLAGKVFR